MSSKTIRSADTRPLNDRASSQSQPSGDTLFAFMQRVIKHLRHLGQIRTGETYQSTLNSFMRFRKGKDVKLKKLTPDLIVDYESYLKQQGISLNTLSFYMRVLRAVHNRAIEEGVAEPYNLFKRVYTGIPKTTKRAVSLQVIRQIKALNLTRHPALDYARDLFLFSFYTRGMSFIDMSYLKKGDLQNGVLSYRRKKTGQQLFIKWEKCMQGIVDKYFMENSPYLLPIIRKTERDERKQYKNATFYVNRKLKEIAKKLELSVPLTMYVARHSWASIAKSKKIPISVISEGMGHNSEKTTQIYLASLDNAVVDKANSLILKLL